MAGTTTWAVAVKKATTWGTAVAVVAGDGVKIASETLADGVPEPVVDENVGDSLAGGTYQGNVTVEGNLVVPARFMGFEKLTALLMAQDTVTIDQAGKSFYHAQIFQPSNAGILGTIAINKGVGSTTHEYPTAKFSSMELAHANGRLVGTLGVIANRCERVAPTNNAAAINAATPPSTGHLMLFTQLEVRMTEVTGAEGNLTGSHTVKVSEAKFSVNRNLKGDNVTGSNGEIDEPETDGLPEGMLSLSFPNYSAAVDAFVTQAQRAQTARVPKTYKASLVWTGAVIPTTSPTVNYMFEVMLPALTIAKAPTNATAPGAKVPVQIDLNVTTPQSAANGTDWSWVVAGSTPFRLRYLNGNATSALA